MPMEKLTESPIVNLPERISNLSQNRGWIGTHLGQMRCNNEIT
jgi:hypothetical protein